MQFPATISTLNLGRLTANSPRVHLGNTEWNLQQPSGGSGPPL